MSLRRVGGLAAIVLATLILLSCGQVYRPVVIPVAVTPPNSQNYHAVFAISTNAQANPGTALQIDVSGDTNVGEANMGVTPTHAAVLPNFSRVLVTSAGSLFAGQTDAITAFTPASQSVIATGLGTPITFSLPNVGPLGTNGAPTWACSYLPDYVTTVQNTLAYVANYGVENNAACLPYPTSTDSIAMLNVVNNTITNISYQPAASHPVAMVETPNAQNLYVVNEGNNTVSNLSPTDLSTIATISVGSTPVWAVARPDNRRVYVLTQGSGTVVPIDVATNTILPTATDMNVGAGANFILYDPSQNRLYVTNPGSTNPNNAAVYIYSTTGGTDLSGNANDTPTLLAVIPMTPGSTLCPSPNGCSPVSVTALADGSRFYIASYETEANCSDPDVGPSAPCIIPMLTIFDAPSMTVKPPTSTLLTSSPSLSLLTSPQFSATQYGVPPLPSCVPAATYSPGTTRFRMFTTSSTDSSHVYVSICDAGAIADISTKTDTIATGTNTPDTLITDIPAPFGNCSVGGTCSAVATITGVAVNSNVVTFTAANNFTTGTRVEVSGLTSSVGTPLNGQTLIVIATGLSATQFEATVPASLGIGNGSSADSGTAVPLQPPQSPVFLLPGQ